VIESLNQGGGITSKQGVSTVKLISEGSIYCCLPLLPQNTPSACCGLVYYKCRRHFYGYSFYQTDKIDIAFSTEIVGLKIDSTVESVFAGTEKNDDFLPLPVFGFRSDYILSPNFLFKAGIDYF